MTDVTPTKRVLPARERRESAAKRLASSPLIQSSPASKAATLQTEPPRQKRKYTKRASLVKVVERTTQSSTPGLVEEVLPTKFTASKPLPVLREKQQANLSNNDYQSIADSAILAASLHRSRMQWLCEGVLKRYWVKPVKRKGVIEQPPGNPDIKSMQKLGNATIEIEPHTFDVTFYTVKDPNSVQAPYQRHPNQHTTKPPYPVYPPAGHATSTPTTPRPSQPASHAQPPPQPPLPNAVSSAATNSSQEAKKEPGVSEPSAGATSATPAATSTPSATPARAPASTPTTQPTTTPAVPPKPTDDPVIQMLAARAATDPRLKDLMKVVAMSKATQEQLREFQRHIDEFNAIVKRRDTKKVEAEGKAKAPTSASPASRTATPVGRPPLPTSAPAVAPSPGLGGPMHMHPPPYPVYHPPYRPEPIIKHIVVEFHSPVSSSQGPTTDRWLFPEHAVLEMQPGGMDMVASFFAERSGAEILEGVEDSDDAFRQKYRADVDYYEPVTMKIRATQHRTIETIARAATTLPEVVRHMKEVMAKKTRAPREYLVHRLPRDKALSEPAPGPTPTQTQAPGDFVDSGVDISEAEDDELQDYYGI